MHQTTLTFPEINLRQSDGHKLRGYFAQTFGQHSDLFHNHQADGKTIYRYPLIQYKVVDKHPMVVGINEGAQLITQRFLSIKEIIINQKQYSLHQKNLKSETVEVAVHNDLFTYQLVTPWLALNQHNHTQYQNADDTGKRQLLKKTLTGNLLTCAGGLGYRLTEKLLVNLVVQPISINFKSKQMTGFKGSFTTNLWLPDFVGIGKSPARGFGTIKLQQ